MTYYNPPHKVRDEAKLQGMIDTLQSGGQLPPVVVYGNDAYTGSHRIAAWEACEMDVQAIALSDQEFMLAVAAANGVDDLDVNDPDDIDFFNQHLLADIYDYSAFCQALLKSSNNDDVKNAVKDQID